MCTTQMDQEIEKRQSKNLYPQKSTQMDISNKLMQWYQKSRKQIYSQDMTGQQNTTQKESYGLQDAQDIAKQNMNLYNSSHGQGDYYQRKKKNQREKTKNPTQQILKIFQNMSSHSCIYLTRGNLKNYLINENRTIKSI